MNSPSRTKQGDSLLTGSVAASVLVYAARYALGRMSGAASDVEYAVAANLDVLRRDHGCREAMIRDIEEAQAEDNLGMDCDRECWMRTLGRLQSARTWSEA